jgi:hypothetical protein
MSSEEKESREIECEIGPIKFKISLFEFKEESIFKIIPIANERD